MPFSPVEEIVEDIKQGKMVIVCDDEDRENEGDLTMAAELVTADDINFMAAYGRGLICLPMAGEIVDRLDIPQMVTHNASRMGTAFTASIEAKEGITTGISAADRAHTCRVAVDEATGPEDLVMPGHVFPLRAKDGGVLQRAGHVRRRDAEPEAELEHVVHLVLADERGDRLGLGQGHVWRVLNDLLDRGDVHAWWVSLSLLPRGRGQLRSCGRSGSFTRASVAGSTSAVTPVTDVSSSSTSPLRCSARWTKLE